MPKHLTDILKGVKSSTIDPMKLPDDMEPHQGAKDFIAQHKVEKHADRVGNTDAVYKGITKKADMARHGYKSPEDKKVNFPPENKKKV